MNEKRFNPKKLQKLNNPARLKDIPVETVLGMLDFSRQKSTIVEIGAGTAFFSIAFLEKTKASKLYACDISETMVKWITKNVVPNHPEIVPVQTREKRVPLQTEIADLVFMINLHHELQDPALLLNESYRLLKPGGNVLIIDWKKQDMAEGPPTDIRVESDTVTKQLEKAGFCKIICREQLEKHLVVTGTRA